mgnify:CR=1 FL=1
MTANTPPKPHAEGDKFTNTETGITYEFKSGAWRAVSSEAADAVVDAISELNLEKVLVAGNVATQGATFGGKVIVEPGSTGNEVVTASQLAELNQEIEDIRPSLERGLWSYDSSSTNPNTGNYIGYKLKADATYCNEQLVACQLAAGDDPTAKAACTREHGDCTAGIGSPVLDVGWSDVDFISINKQDSNGELHTFADVEIGMYVEVMDIDGGGFGLYQIVEPGIAAGGQRTGFWVQHISSEGQQEGSVRVKIFEMSSANPADYVRKAGDTMTGQLQIRPEQSKDTGLVVFAGKGSLDNDKTAVFAVTNYKGHEILRVYNHGRIRAGSSAIDYTPEYDSDVVTKKYVDSHGSIPGSPYKLTSKAKKDLSPGEFMKETSNVYHCHPTDMNGVTHYPSTSNREWTGLWAVFKIYDGTGQKVAAHTCTTVWAQGKDNYIAWKNDTSFINTTLTVGDTYYLADGLFLSY